MEKSYYSLFLQGNFKKVRTQFELEKKSKPDPYVLGSMVFLGQVVDAGLYFDKWQSQYTLDELVICHFFLATGYIRSSDFKNGKAHLFSCFKLRHSLRKANSKFFIYQAFGFYKYFACRYQGSAYWAQKSWKHSLLTDFEFGQIFSCDLLAHALLEKGEIEKGFEQIEKAISIAKKFGRGSLIASLEVAKLSYQATYGIKPEKVIQSLQKKFSEFGSAKDSYSKSNLGLELARQLVLRGKTNRALSVLKTIQPDVFKFGHRRQKSAWFFRLAYIENLKGNRTSCADRLQYALKELNQDYDLAHLLQIRGLQFATSNLDAKKKAELENQIRYLTFRTGSVIALKQWSRLNKSKSNLSEDHLGNLIDEISLKKNSTLETTQQICESGYYQLLRNYLKEPGKKHVFLEVLPRSLTIVNDGSVDYFSDVMTPLLQRILSLLQSGPKTKKEIVEKIWEYQYDSLRHDQLVHAALTRLRKAFGSAAVWIKNESDFYLLDSDVQVDVLAHAKTFAPEHQKERLAEDNQLNYRQIKLLSVIRKSEPISIQDCIRILQTTKITANRDVKGLLEFGLIKKSGQGKSTRYH